MSGEKLFFHVDLDAFFASVEQVENPLLKGMPVIVGAKPGTRGVVSACSYEAREFGVRSAMPISRAFELCPGAAFLPVRMHLYSVYSGKVFSVLDDFSPSITPVSIDEAFLDMGGMRFLYPDPEVAARELKSRVFAETGLRISVGIASSRFVAKLASARGKPDGCLRIEAGQEEAFIDSIPLFKLWGIGSSTAERLAELNLGKAETIRLIALDRLQSLFGNSLGLFLYKASRGEEVIEMDAGNRSERKSLSTERTFEVDLSDRRDMEQCLSEMGEELMYQLWSQDLSARTVTLKMRYADFSGVQASRSQDEFIPSSARLFEIAVDLFRSRYSGAPCRLLGVGLGTLSKGSSSQPSLFGGWSERDSVVEKAFFELRSRGKGRGGKARNLRTEDDAGDGEATPDMPRNGETGKNAPPAS